MKIEQSKALGRAIRRDEGSELTRSTWDELGDALRSRDFEAAGIALNYAAAEARMMLESAVNFAKDALTHLSNVASCDEHCARLKRRYTPMTRRSQRISAGWGELRGTIDSGKADETLAGLDARLREARSAHDEAISFVDDALSHLAHMAGEEQVNQFLRRRYEPVIKLWVQQTPGVRESIERAVEYQRAHFGEVSLREEADRFVVTCDPCGSGGRLRRTKDVVRVKEAHDWSWNKDDVPLYCTHCAVMWEILPMEIRGIPIRINLPPKKNADSCVHLYYKSADAIPDEYYKRVSRSRK